MAKPPQEDSFLSRWSRRKAEARAEETAPPPPPEPEPAPAPAPAMAPAPEAITPEELAALPKIEDLVPGDDIRAFLRPGVPAPLKNAALRKMWLLTPAIRDYRDPAVDYAWDWNTPGGVPGDGAAPSAERAAQMLRDLVTPRPQPVPQAADPEDPAAPDMAEAPAPDVDMPAEDVPTDAHIPQSAHDKNLSNQSDTDAPILRRRHGGAAPN